MKRKLLQYAVFDWPRKIAAVCWSIILYQILSWLGELVVNGYYLLDETYSVIEGSLFACLALAWLVPKPSWLRETLQVIAVCAVTLVALGYEYVWLDGYPLVDNLEMNVSQIAPFIWYALGTWFVMSFMTEWARTRVRIMSAMILLIVFFCIYDSFSQIYLWKNVAYVVFAGLLLLIAQHYSQFREKHPGSWQQLKEYPAAVVIPIVLVIAASITAGTMAPSISPLVTDPYSAWKTWKGEEVNKIGKSYADFEISGFLGNASSGYGRDDSTLGGGFDYDYSPVMQVSTNRSSYWRGESLNVYTGKGWIESDSERATSGVAPGTAMPEFPGFNDDLLETVEVEQTVTMLKEEESYPVLFGAFELQQVSSLDNSQFPALRWGGESGELFWNEATPYPRQYTVVSQMPVIDESGLKQTSASLPEAVEQQYLQLPDELPERVRELAQELTAGAGNDYEKAKIIEQYLKLNFIYTNEPDMSKVSSADFVDGFLFELKEGYCDYYSTAMAVMLRSIDIPTRWVKGFSTGTLPIESMELDIIMERIQESGGAGTYTVVNADAHSWVEVYFDGYGWIPFEPTSIFTMPTASAVDPAEESLPTLGEVDDAEGDEAASEGFPWRDIAVWGSVAVLLAAAAAALWYWKPAWLAAIRLPRRKPIESYNAQMVREYERFVRYARRKGYPLEPSDTAREMLSGWLKYNRGMRTDFDQLVHLFERAKYSRAKLNRDEYEKGSELAKRLKKVM